MPAVRYHFVVVEPTRPVRAATESRVICEEVHCGTICPVEDLYQQPECVEPHFSGLCQRASPSRLSALGTELEFPWGVETQLVGF